jgi:hypothetical protein
MCIVLGEVLSSDSSLGTDVSYVLEMKVVVSINNNKQQGDQTTAENPWFSCFLLLLIPTDIKRESTIDQAERLDGLIEHYNMWKWTTKDVCMAAKRPRCFIKTPWEIAGDCLPNNIPNMNPTTVKPYHWLLLHV